MNKIDRLHYSRPLTPTFFAGASHEDIKWTINYLVTLLEMPENKEKEENDNLRPKSSWIESMSKFRRLEPVLDDKETLFESLDERYKWKFSLIQEIPDFEDMVQLHSAVLSNAECIITRNVKDFVTAEIPVMTPEAFIKTS